MALQNRQTFIDPVTSNLAEYSAADNRRVGQLAKSRRDDAAQLQPVFTFIITSIKHPAKSDAANTNTMPSGPPDHVLNKVAASLVVAFSYCSLGDS